MKIKKGEMATDFSLPNQNGDIITLSKLKGSNVLIYFYPKDSTPGCTKEACSFRDIYSDIKAKDTIILGISADSAKSHTNFIEKHNLPFDLLTDSDKSIIELYGALGIKKLFGRTYKGILRNSVLIDKKGQVVEYWEKVNPLRHSNDVLETLSKLNQ